MTIPDEVIANKIFQVGDQKIITDEALSELYGISNEQLLELVYTHIARFPVEFMFRLPEDARPISGYEPMPGTLARQPFCFTGYGVTLLSCLIDTDRASQANVQLVRVFRRLDDFFNIHIDFANRIDEVEKQIVSHDKRIKKVEEMDDETPVTDRNQIGFKYGLAGSR